jgi:hypothetical protein
MLRIAAAARGANLFRPARRSCRAAGCSSAPKPIAAIHAEAAKDLNPDQ